ncbi:MAG TPA: TolC family protein, partial [Opitutus sp.]|nr:TolC family protein [Opitutus sp.]
DQGENKWTLGLTLELPLFNQNQGPIAEAVARRREAAAQFLAAQAQAIAEIDAAATAQAAAATQLGYLRRAQHELDAQQAGAESRQRAGAGDAYEVASADIAAAAGRTALLDAESQAALASGQLEDALQIPFVHLAALESAPRAGRSPSPP